MDQQETNNQTNKDEQITDLQLTEAQADQTKGGEEAAGGGRVSISSFNFMKK